MGIPSIMETGVKTIRGLAPLIKSGAVSVPKLVQDTLTRISRLDPAINSYITVLSESALREGEMADKQIAEGRYLGPLHGIPIAVKDLFYIKGVRMTAGSKILFNHIANYDSTVIRRLHEAGAILLGTTNLHEFAAGATNVNPFFGAVHNPWDLTRISGGSSGGSAAAVSAGLALGALGTDTAGSVRIPAALCGVVGLKPTYGMVSKFGVIPPEAAFDTVGVLTRCAWDAAALFSIITGHDPLDPTSVRAEVLDFIAGVEESFSHGRIGVPRGFFQDVIDQRISKFFERFITNLGRLEVASEDVEIKDIDRAFDIWFPIHRAENAAFHAEWYPSRSSEYGEDVRRGLQSGMEVTAVQYLNAQKSRARMEKEMVETMSHLDYLALPTVAVPAPRIGEDPMRVGGKAFDVHRLLIKLTVPFNVTGFPSLSLPIGSIDGLPVGAQIVGKPFEEVKIMALANAYEEKYGLFGEPTLN